MQNKKILISAVAYDSGLSGISNYIENVIREFSKHVAVDVIINESDDKLFYNYPPNVNFILLKKRFEKPIFNVFWHTFIFPITQLTMGNYDFVFLPTGNRRLQAFYPHKTIVTMHDLSQFRVNKKYDIFRMFYVKNIIPRLLKNTHKLVSISQSTKNDMIKFFKTPADKVIVNHNGVDFSKFNPKFKNPAINQNKKFFLYLARLEHPGKNHVNLIQSYLDLDEKIQSEYDLILIGSDWNGSHKIKDLAKKNTNIKIKGYVSDSDLSVYFATASLFIFPSFFEGFGIPILQAMSSGVPVISSNTSSMPEVCGDSALMFNPNSNIEIKNAIIRVITNKKLNQKMVKKGFSQCEKFTWELHVSEILKIAKEA